MVRSPRRSELSRSRRQEQRGKYRRHRANVCVQTARRAAQQRDGSATARRLNDREAQWYVLPLLLRLEGEVIAAAVVCVREG
ncbi:hypothetical protein V5799_013397 [Amblyomma americanum]|uniref:Uncharacterized protein n=1 Tax=Amblyomma americanum TaxID=6943 RepID=A0AAQ4E613_AMBAM